MKKIVRQGIYIILLVLLFYVCHYFFLYKIKIHILKDTPFIVQLYSVYETFYMKHGYIPDQQELLKSISNVEYENLKWRLKFFKCNMIVSEDYYYIYEFGFDGLDNHLQCYIDKLENYRFVDMLLHKKEDVLLFQVPTKNKIKKDRMKQEGIESLEILPPPPLKINK